MITLKSHGFKFSRPEANYYFDVSFFKNPWRDEKIRNEKSKEKRKKLILGAMTTQPSCDAFVDAVSMMLRTIHNEFPDENIQVAFCCSAGEYRSPAIVELVAEELKKFKINTVISHSKNSKV